MAAVVACGNDGELLSIFTLTGGAVTPHKHYSDNHTPYHTIHGQIYSYVYLMEPENKKGVESKKQKLDMLQRNKTTYQSTSVMVMALGSSTQLRTLDQSALEWVTI